MTLVAALGVEHPIEAALTGVGSLSAAIEAGVAITASLTGAGSLAADVASSIPIQATLTGTGSLSADLVLSIPITAALSGSGVLSATLEVAGAGVAITAALSGSGTLSASVAVEVPISAALTGSGALSATLGVPAAAAVPTVPVGMTTYNNWPWIVDVPWQRVPVVVEAVATFRVYPVFEATIQQPEDPQPPAIPLSDEARDLFELAALGVLPVGVAIIEALEERELVGV